jgi:predicted short-subunit dehydrogenase-like oxidoreductase (DUF2520 family)
MNKPFSFVSIGAGNVASHLVRGFTEKGCRLLQVYSRTGSSARSLAEKYNSEYTDALSELRKDADFYMIAVPDTAIPGLMKSFPFHDRLVFHTAGSTGLEVFDSSFSDFGILYPLQTFTRDTAMDLSRIPLLIEAGNETSLEKMRKIAGLISENVNTCDTDTRLTIHLAAVFACNFTNHMYALANDVLREKGIDPAILEPLIAESYKKSRTLDPLEAQTGPASRNDEPTMEKHIKLLEGNPLMQKIYTFTSRSIQSKRSPGKKKSGK